MNATNQTNRMRERNYRLRRMFCFIKDRFSKDKGLTITDYRGKAMTIPCTIRDLQLRPDFKTLTKCQSNHYATAGTNDHSGNRQTGIKYEQGNKNNDRGLLEKVMSDIAKVAKEIATMKENLTSCERGLQYLANGDWCKDAIFVIPDTDFDRFCHFLECKKAECVYLRKEIDRQEKIEKKMILQAKKDFVALQNKCVGFRGALSTK